MTVKEQVQKFIDSGELVVAEGQFTTMMRPFVSTKVTQTLRGGAESVVKTTELDKDGEPKVRLLNHKHSDHHIVNGWRPVPAELIAVKKAPAKKRSAPKND